MKNKLFILDNDYLFKKIFSNQKYLKHLLLNFFNIKARKLEYLNSELVKQNKDGKVGIVDLLLIVDGKIVILELQNLNRHNFKERLLFYSSSVIANHCLTSGEDYDKLKEIKVCAIINYQLFNYGINNKVKLTVKNKIFTEKLEYQIFDLTKINITDKDTKYYELASLFKEKDLNKLTLETKNILNKEILDSIKRYNFNREEYRKMEDIEKLMMSETEHYDTAYRAGKREGLSQGKNEEKIDIAKNLLNKNIDIDLVIDVTGLTKKQIEFLYEQI